MVKETTPELARGAWDPSGFFSIHAPVWEKVWRMLRFNNKKINSPGIGRASVGFDSIKIRDKVYNRAFQSFLDIFPSFHVFKESTTFHWLDANHGRKKEQEM